MQMAVSQNENAPGSYFKIILRDIFYSEELKIDSQFAKDLEAKLDEICCDNMTEEQTTVFQYYFSIVEVDAKAKKSIIKSKGKELSYKDIHLYQAEQVPNLLVKFPLLADSLREPILWQIKIDVFSD